MPTDYSVPTITFNDPNNVSRLKFSAVPSVFVFRKKNITRKAPAKRLLPSSCQLPLLPDACHMLKLARSALNDFQILKDNQGREIKWS